MSGSLPASQARLPVVSLASEDPSDSLFRSRPFGTCAVAKTREHKYRSPKQTYVHVVWREMSDLDCFARQSQSRVVRRLST